MTNAEDRAFKIDVMRQVYKLTGDDVSADYAASIMTALLDIVAAIAVSVSDDDEANLDALTPVLKQSLSLARKESRKRDVQH